MSTCSARSACSTGSRPPTARPSGRPRLLVEPVQHGLALRRRRRRGPRRRRRRELVVVAAGAARRCARRRRRSPADRSASASRSSVRDCASPASTSTRAPVRRTSASTRVGERRDVVAPVLLDAVLHLQVLRARRRASCAEVLGRPADLVDLSAGRAARVRRAGSRRRLLSTRTTTAVIGSGTSSSSGSRSGAGPQVAAGRPGGSGRSRSSSTRPPAATRTRPPRPTAGSASATARSSARERRLVGALLGQLGAVPRPAQLQLARGGLAVVRGVEVDGGVGAGGLGQLGEEVQVHPDRVPGAPPVNPGSAGPGHRAGGDLGPLPRPGLARDRPRGPPPARPRRGRLTGVGRPLRRERLVGPRSAALPRGEHAGPPAGRQPHPGRTARTPKRSASTPPTHGAQTAADEAENP